MRHLRWILVSLLLLAAGSAWAHDEKLQAELLDEVLRLSHAEVPDQIILDQIDAWGFVFELTADDIVELRTLGVSDAVVEALIQTAGWEGGDLVVAPRTRLYVSAGFYSPWYCFPYAWGGYYDPFPRLYACHYYPFYYSVSFGYYGWYGGTYYAHYYPRAWHRQAWRNGGRHPSKSPYTVASGLPARRAETIAGPRSKRGGAGTAVSPRVIRGSRNGTPAPRLRRAEQLRTPQGSRPARAVQSRSLQRNSSPVLRTGQSRRATRVQTPTWQRGNSRRSAVDRALPRTRTWSTRTGSRSSPLSRMQSAPRMRSMSRMQSAPRMHSMPRGGVPSGISSRFGAARSR